ncbi:hypothetical protein E2C01_071525 [Portunus trituberculatus]|uniref:Uncharacterized protein n=1 Tax=Portunus trituberculatus TaxID=210409 RepID=A0A5B7HX82_PORTR|nr:hypothetical protein [Portunus trituberculatus]
MEQSITLIFCLVLWPHGYGKSTLHKIHSAGRWVRSTAEKCCPMVEESHLELWWKTFCSVVWSLATL